MIHNRGEGSSEYMKNNKKVAALITSMSLCMTGCGAKERAETYSMSETNMNVIELARRIQGYVRFGI